MPKNIVWRTDVIYATFKEYLLYDLRKKALRKDEIYSNTVQTSKKNLQLSGFWTTRSTRTVARGA